MIKFCSILFYGCVSCSFIVNFFDAIDTYIPEDKQKIGYFILLMISVYLSFIGILFMKLSLGLLIAVAISGAVYYLSSAVEDTGKIPFVSREMVNWITDYVENHMLLSGLIIFVISIAIASVIIVFFQSFTWIGGIILSIYIYNEIFTRASLFGIELDNLYIRWTAYILFLVAVWFIFLRLPNIVFAMLFAVVGGAVFLPLLEQVCGKDWGFKDTLIDLCHRRDISLVDLHVVYCAVFVAFSAGMQIILALKGK